MASPFDRLASIPLPRTPEDDNDASPQPETGSGMGEDVPFSPMPSCETDVQTHDVQDEKTRQDWNTEPKGLELPVSVVPIHPEKTMSGYIGESFDGWTKAFVITIIVLLGGFLVTSLLILRGPLSSYAHSRSLEAEKELLETEEKKRYDILESDITSSIRMIDEKMERLNCDAKALGVKIENHLGAPLDYLQLHPPERPRELDLAILESDTLALHWAGVANAASRGYPSPHLHLALQDIRRRIETKQLVPADRQLVIELLSLVQLEERFAFERGHHLHLFAGLMDALRFEDNLREYGKDNPR